jgi:hypothetical protein
MFYANPERDAYLVVARLAFEDTLHRQLRNKYAASFRSSRCWGGPDRMVETAARRPFFLLAEIKRPDVRY